jgi:hypothetical protein
LLVVGLVRDRTHAREVEEFMLLEELLQALAQHVVGDGLVSGAAPRPVADLDATEAALGVVDALAGERAGSGGWSSM